MVYLAEQLRPFRRAVALKVLRTHLVSEDAVLRFEQELQTLARLRHDSIAQVYDYYARGRESPFFTMEYVEGPPITDFADSRRLATRERVELFLQVCDAVQYIHQNGVIHRDLGASNILVEDRDGEASVKLVDFGVAKLAREHRHAGVPATDENRILGTLGYMSPEQIGEGRVDTRADVYSLGVLLYELLTGSLPIDRPKSMAEMPEFLRCLREKRPELASCRIRGGAVAAADVARRRGVTPRTLRKELSNDLDWVLQRALEKEPSGRYGTAADLARDLRAHLRGEPVSVGPHSALYHLRQGIRRNLKYVAAALLTITMLAAVAALSAFWHLRLGAEHERHVRILQLGEAVQVSVANAHLWLEEAVAGDPDVDLTRDVYTPIDDSTELVRAALDGGRTPVGTFDAEDEPALVDVLRKLGRALGDFQAIARARWVQRLDKGATGSVLDRQCDTLYEDILRLSSSISILATHRPLDETQRINRTILVANVLAVAVSLVFLVAVARSWAARSRQVSNHGSK